MRPAFTAHRYMSTWMLVDIFVLLLDVLLLLGVKVMLPKYPSGFDRYVKLLRLCRFVRVARMHKVKTLTTFAYNGMFTEGIRSLTRLSRPVLVMLIINHNIAWVWYGVAQYRSHGANTWLVQHDLQDDTRFYIYVTCMHWSLSQFTLATNNIAPSNAIERLFACGVVCFALLYFSSFISSVTNVVHQLRMLGAAEAKSQANLRAFISRKAISVSLGRQLQRYCKGQWMIYFSLIIV